MAAHTHYLWFETRKRQEIIDITETMAEQVRASGIVEGYVLVSAMHISASVFVTEHEHRGSDPKSTPMRNDTYLRAPFDRPRFTDRAMPVVVDSAS